MLIGVTWSCVLIIILGKFQYGKATIVNLGFKQVMFCWKHNFENIDEKDDCYSQYKYFQNLSLKEQPQNASISQNPRKKRDKSIVVNNTHTSNLSQVKKKRKKTFLLQNNKC